MFRIFNRAKPFRDLNAADFEKEMNRDADAVILDVRTPGEYALGRIPGALNMDITRGDFDSWVEGLDKDKTYYVYCRGGNRSIAACTILGSKGFRSCNLAEGIYTWKGPLEGA